MKSLIYLTILTTSLLGATGAATPPAPLTNISTQSSYAQDNRTTVIFRMDISSYFSANGMNVGTSALLFPDNGVIQAYGLDPGTCQQHIGPFGPICTNYRFICQAMLPASNLSNTHAVFNLIDLNALYLHNEDDPPGTCYLTPYQDGNGQSVLGVSAIVTYEPQFGVADRIGTMGWFAVLSGGAKALVPGNCISFAIAYNPHPGDPGSFTWGDGTTILQDVFQLIAVGNADEPVQVSGVSGGVFQRSSQGH